MVKFEFATATRILFGAGTIQQAGKLAADFGRKALVVNGLAEERASPLLATLSSSDVEVVLFEVSGEPTIQVVQAGARLARQAGCNLVVGFGGGSALDTGKAVAALLTNPGDLGDYLEVVGSGNPITNLSAPFIAIPTTAGTGSEVTRNAVLGVPDLHVKVSMRSLNMLPRLALVDPELTYSLPPGITASTGLDALTQLIEPFVSVQANPMTDAICRDGMRRAARSLLRAYKEGGSDPQSREDMALASLFGGMALANAKLGAAHGFAAPLGGMFPAPHGAVCARLLPHVMKVNLRALKERSPSSKTLPRYDEVAQILTGNPSASAEEGVSWIQELCAALNIAALSNYGVTPRHFPMLIEKAAQASSMQGNPVQLTSSEMEEILSRAL